MNFFPSSIPHFQLDWLPGNSFAPGRRSEHRSLLPFFGIIRRESLKAAGDRRAVVSDKSVSDTIKESLHTGCLSIYKDLDNRFDNGAVWTVLVTYWTAVKDAFPEAWGRPPTQSRLMHGAGIRAMGRLMDRMLGSLRAADLQDPQVIRGPLNALAAHCHWTSGRWMRSTGIGTTSKTPPGH